MDVYLLPGLGTDQRLFSRMDLSGLNVRYLNWPAYERGCTLADIAAQLRPQVDADRPHVLAGVSMGGMVAQELAALTQPERVLLISTWTGPHEWPWTVHLGARLGVQRVIRERTMRGVWPLKQWLVGQGNKEVDRLLYDMACDEGAVKLRNGLDAIFRWQGSPWKGPVVRIHGDADRLVPMRFAVDHRVADGGHTMVVYKASEVAAMLREALTRPVTGEGELSGQG